MRFFPTYVALLRKQWVTLYGRPEPASRYHWDKHIEYLKRVVPAEKLVFYDVREGWEPLCRALGEDVPAEEFPRVNDSRAIDELARRMVVRGLGRWAVVGASVGVGALGWWWARW